jgi:acyl carrier protein
MKAEIAEARGNERKTETEKNFRGEKRFGVDSIDMFFFLNKSSFQFLQEQTFAL